MKTRNMVIAAMVLMSVGCASKKEAPAASLTACGAAYCETALPDTNGDGIPDAPGVGTDPAVTGYAGGSTAALNLNGSALGRLFYNSQPGLGAYNVRINVSLTSNTEAIIISYVENGILKEAAFGTQHPTNANISNARYNGWVTENGQQVWKGFFQDRYGAIVLIVDRYLSQGDGQAATILGGSVYFQNFIQNVYNNPIQGPEKMCWEITLGPYDCRSFLSGNSVVMTSSATPTTRGPSKNVSYERLGDFAGISRSSSGF